MDMDVAQGTRFDMPFIWNGRHWWMKKTGRFTTSKRKRERETRDRVVVVVMSVSVARFGIISSLWSHFQSL